MKLIDMKQETKPDAETAVAPAMSEDYPYGLRINLDKDEIDKIPSLADFDAGTMVNIIGLGKVVDNTRTTESVDSTPEGKKVTHRHSISIQIMEIGVADKDNAEESFKEATGPKEEWEKYPR